MMVFNICPHCATEFRTNSLHERRSCPNCSYYYTAAAYTEEDDDDEYLEDTHYADILANFREGKSYLLECKACGSKARMYLEEADCHCGERLRLDAEPALSPEELKKIRKKLGHSQVSMGALLGVSQGFYSHLESGRKPLSDVPTVAKRLSVISAHAIIPRSNSEIIEMR